MEGLPFGGGTGTRENPHPEPITETSNVTVRLLNIGGEPFVLKVPLVVGGERALERPPTEEERVNALSIALNFLKGKVATQDPAREILQGTGVYCPEEHYIIMQGEDGLPVPVVVQKYVEGRQLREVVRDAGSEQGLPEEAGETLIELLKVNRKCFLNTAFVLT